MSRKTIVDRSIAPQSPAKIYTTDFPRCEPRVRTYPYSVNVLALQIRNHETLKDGGRGQSFYIAHQLLTVEEAEELIANLRTAIRSVRATPKED